MKCPRCSVPLPSDNEAVCQVCGYQFGLSSRTETSSEAEIESTPRKVEAALATEAGDDRAVLHHFSRSTSTPSG